MQHRKDRQTHAHCMVLCVSFYFLYDGFGLPLSFAAVPAVAKLDANQQEYIKEVMMVMHYPNACVF